MTDIVSTARPVARVALLAAVEIAAVFVCARLVMAWSGWTPDAALLQALVFALVLASVAAASGVMPAPPGRIGAGGLAAAALGAVLATAALAGLLPDRFAVGGGLAIGAAAAVAVVIALRWTMRVFAGASADTRRVLVLGNGQEAEDVIRTLNRSPSSRPIEYAGLYPVMAERDAHGRERMFDHDALMRTVADLRVTEIVVAVRERRGGVMPLRQLLDCRLAGIDVLDLVTFHEREHRMLRVDLLRASWMIFGEGFEQPPLRRAVKRAGDVASAALLLVLGSPVWLATLVAVRLDDRGPVFVAEPCVGLGGRHFERLSLRTVGHDDAHRVTRAGGALKRWRLHGWPALLNVLRGDMSLVGPRAESPESATRNAERVAFHAVRQAVRPGLTGWAQVNARPAAHPGDAAAELPFDLYYVKRHSPGLDLAILVRALRWAPSGKDRDPSTRR